MGKILKNSSYLLGAQIVARIISFFYILFLAKFLSVENFGLYTVAFSYFSLISGLAELGMNRYLTREVAIHRDGSKKKLSSILCSMLIFRLAFVSIIFAVFALVLSLTDPDQMRVTLTLLAVSAILPQAIAFSLDSVYVGLEKLLLCALGLLGLNIVTTFLGVYFVLAGFGVIGVTASLVFGFIAYALVLALLSFHYGVRFLKKDQEKNNSLTFNLLKEVIQGSLPYGVLGVLGLIYFKIDAILLSYMKGSFEVGIYGAAYKFLEAIVFIPSSVATALFPVLSRLHQDNIAQVKQLYFKTLASLFGLSVFVLIGFVTILPMIIRFYLPQFNDSILVLLVLSLTIPFIFIHVPGAIVVLSTDKYLKEAILLSIAAVIFNLVGNIIFIPRYGAFGAAIVTVLSEVLSFIIFFVFLQIKVFKK